MLRKSLVLLLIGLFHINTIFAQSLTEYYKTADKTKKEQLKTALYKIISNHKTLGYKSLWSYYETTDACIDNPKQVFDMFSSDTYYFSSVGNAMNKEHVVPQSWWGKGSKYPIYSDLLNVYPSETKANSAKSNYPLGKVNGKGSFDNGRIKVGKSATTGYSDNVVEPCDEFKGDFARIYLYDATCYQNLPWDGVAKAFPKGGNTYPTLDSWIIPLLLEWNRLDPPSTWEIERNNRVYKVQGNRNPFIDYPQLAEYIWGDSISYTWDLETAVPHSIGGKNNGSDPGVIPVPDPGNDDDPGKDNPDDGDEEDDDDDEDPEEPQVAPTGYIFNYSFEDVEEGKSTTTGGSSAAWHPANEYINSAKNCYEAGKAVRVGTKSEAGSIQTKNVTVAKGSNVTLEVLVKGWSEIEGDLVVSATGFSKEQVKYTATMKDDFEMKRFHFNDVPQDYISFTISTSAKRCFIGSIRAYIGTDPATGIEVVPSTRSTNGVMYNLSGQRVDSTYRGIVIINGRKCVK